MTRPVDERLAAVRGRDRAAAAAALDRDPSLVTARTASGETPVLLAIYHRAPDVLTLLRARGATLDGASNPRVGRRRERVWEGS